MQKVFHALFRLFLFLCITVVLLLALMTAAEYRPAETEPLSVSSLSSHAPEAGKEMKILIWNIGYGALGDNADFFMDGGKGVMTADKERVLSNITGIIDAIASEEPDLILLQEVDLSAKRSRFIDETQLLKDAFEDYQSVFAYNYRAMYVPYPLPAIGKVESGLVTLSRFGISEAERVALPCPFSWPVRTVNLKRGLLVSRIPVAGTDKDLILIDLHLEAYDNGEGKIEQTRVLSALLKEAYDNGDYVVAGGDFNQVFSNIDVSAYPVRENRWQPGLIDVSGFDPVFSFLMDPASPTCRSLDKPYAGASREDFQYYMIDGFIVSDNVTVLSVGTVDLGFVFSDHNPVILNIKLD